MALSSRAVIVATSTAVAATVWKMLQWRARQRAKKIVRHVRDHMKEDGPLINYNDPVVRERILATAFRRASNWMSLAQQHAKPMVGQVGGVASHKKPLLTLAPDYVLKPVITDHRGVREIAFYEAIRLLAKTKQVQHAYSAFLSGQHQQKSKLVLLEWMDTVAMALAIFCQDAVVLNAEIAVRDAWRGLRREVELIRQLQKFLPPYYGVLSLSRAQASQQLTIATATDAPLGITQDAHLLLQDLTINYSKPCVMDLKMGVQSYEPDATPEKRAREYGKYPQQTQFGFRIVGMRFYDPTHAEADGKGFRYFDKPYGRSLTSREQLLDAFRLFLSAGIEREAVEPNVVQTVTASQTDHDAPTSHKAPAPHRTVPNAQLRTRSISNLLVQLRPLRRWFDENKSLRFYASSLLIVYEGDVTHTSRDLTTIKMIDFGRVRREAGGDQGYSTGLTTLKHIFSDLWNEEEQRMRDATTASPITPMPVNS